jgi:alpha-glucosidase
MIALRNAQPALRLGAIDALAATGEVLTFTRRLDDQVIHCAFNIGRAAHVHHSPPGEVILALNGADTRHLPAWGVVFVKAAA